MRISRLPVALLLMVAGFVAAAAQSPNSSPQPGSWLVPTAPRPIAPPRYSQPLLNVQIPSWDLRLEVPPLVHNAKGRFDGEPALPLLNPNTPRWFSLTPRSLRRFQLLPAPSPPVLISSNDALRATESALRRKLTIDGKRCYAIREYQFKGEDPTSDATTFKDYTACEPSTQFHLKGATPAR